MATYIPVSQIVEATLINEGETSMHKYQQRLEWVLRGVKKLNYDTLGNIKTTYVDINSNNTVDLPIDCVNMVRVGVKYGDQFYELTKVPQNKTFPINNDNAGNPIKDLHLKPDWINIYSQYGSLLTAYRFPDGYNLGRVFGYGGGKNGAGYYKEWVERNQLVVYGLKESVTKLYIEYITNGINLTGETIVNEMAEEFLIRWVEYLKAQYQYSNAPTRNSMAFVQELKQTAYFELELLKQRMNPFSIKDFIYATRKSFKQSPKY